MQIVMYHDEDIKFNGIKNMNQFVQQLSDANQRLASLSGASFVAELNLFVNTFYSTQLKAISGYIADSEGTKTDVFGSLIYTANQEQDPIEVQADKTGCAIAVYDTMDLAAFRKAYADIAQAKRLKKLPCPNIASAPRTNVTMGVIFARNSAVPLEMLAEELERLNAQTPSAQWTDMVSILSQGVINYGVQFPGEQVGGDFLPPAEGALKSYIPPIYIVTLMKPTGEYTLHKMIAFITAHLAIFFPSAKLPNWLTMLEGSPNSAITLSGYQYDLRGQLMPVPREQYNDRYLMLPPVLIEDSQGALLSTIQFLPWQNGGVVMLRGQRLPLEGLLVFAGADALKGGVIKLGEIQLSHVIPMSKTSFIDFLNRLQQRSNLVVRQSPDQFVMQKIADEGASSPFIARIYIGPLTLRDTILQPQFKRDEFDKTYQTIVTGLQNLRVTASDLTRLYNDHIQKVSSGQIVRMQGQTIQVDESVHRELAKHTEDFLNGGVRVIKYGMQKIAKLLEVEIGFLFQKHDSFTQGLANLRTLDPALADYLYQTRLWSERFMLARNNIEHDGWQLTPITYSNVNSVIVAKEPQVSGQGVTEFVRFMLDRILCFVEEVITHCIQMQMPDRLSLREIPIAQRSMEMPIRFQVTLIGTGSSLWRITCHLDAFDAV